MNISNVKYKIKREEMRKSLFWLQNDIKIPGKKISKVLDLLNILILNDEQYSNKITLVELYKKLRLKTNNYNTIYRLVDCLKKTIYVIGIENENLFSNIDIYKNKNKYILEFDFSKNLKNILKTVTYYYSIDLTKYQSLTSKYSKNAYEYFEYKKHLTILSIEIEDFIQEMYWFMSVSRFKKEIIPILLEEINNYTDFKLEINTKTNKISCELVVDSQISSNNLDTFQLKIKNLVDKRVNDVKSQGTLILNESAYREKIRQTLSYSEKDIKCMCKLDDWFIQLKKQINKTQNHELIYFSKMNDNDIIVMNDNYCLESVITKSLISLTVEETEIQINKFIDNGGLIKIYPTPNKISHMSISYL